MNEVTILLNDKNHSTYKKPHPEHKVDYYYQPIPGQGFHLVQGIQEWTE